MDSIKIVLEKTKYSDANCWTLKLCLFILLGYDDMQMEHTYP